MPLSKDRLNGLQMAKLSWLMVVNASAVGQHGVPWYARGGLSQNDALLAALFPRYGESALPLLRDAAAEHLTQQLHAFVQLPPDSPLRERMANRISAHC